MKKIILYITHWNYICLLCWCSILSWCCSCSAIYDYQDKREDDHLQQKQQSVLLAIKLPTTQAAPYSRSNEAPTFQDGNDFDNRVTDALVVICNKTQQIISNSTYQLGRNMKKITGGNGHIASIYQVEVPINFEYKSNEKYNILVVLNPTKELLPLLATGKNLKNVVQLSPEIHSITTSVNGLMSDKGIVMSNRNGLQPLNDNAIQENGHISYNDPTKIITINVERTIAKISMELENSINSTKGYVLPVEGDNYTWCVAVENKKMFLYRQFAPAQNGEEEGSDWLSEEQMKKTYATDPNFINIANGNNIEEIDKDKEYPDDFDYYIPNELQNVRNKNNSFSQQYVMENTIGKKNKQKGKQTTMVILKTTYYPKHLTRYEYYLYWDSYITDKKEILQMPKKPNDRTWIQYKDIQMSLSEFAMYLTLATKSVNRIDGFEPKHPGLVEYLNKIHQRGTINGMYEATNYSIFKPVITQLTFTKSLMLDKDGTLTDDPDKAVLTVYKDGINYYPIPIRHFEDYNVEKDKAYGAYGIVRNNIYSVLINKINNPGLNIPMPYISSEYPEPNIKIIVRPWSLHVQKPYI